jgi:acyl-coenzyme A synthetase/AMP-(fatty) acid ligase
VSFWNVPERFNFARDVVEGLPADKLAIRFVDRDGDTRDLTFADVTRRTNQWAALLDRAGIHPGDRVLVLVGKTPEWHPIMLACLKVGAVAIPCSEMLRARDLSFRARHSGAALLISDPGGRTEIDAMETKPDVVYTDEADLGDERAATADTKAADTALLLYTSGTTKDPKAAVHRHAYTYAKRAQALSWLDAKPDDLVWCTAATGWAKSVWNVLLGPWSAGAPIVLHEGGFEPGERFAMLERLAVTVLCQAPTEYRLMAKHGNLDRFDLSQTRHMVSAGEPLNPEVIKAFRDAFGITIHDGYGQTENTLLVGNFPGMEIRPG